MLPNKYARWWCTLLTVVLSTAAGGPFNSRGELPCPTLLPFVVAASYELSVRDLAVFTGALAAHPCVIIAPSLARYAAQTAALEPKGRRGSAVGYSVGGVGPLKRFMAQTSNLRGQLKWIILEREPLFVALSSSPLAFKYELIAEAESEKTQTLGLLGVSSLDSSTVLRISHCELYCSSGIQFSGGTMVVPAQVWNFLGLVEGPTYLPFFSKEVGAFCTRGGRPNLSTRLQSSMPSQLLNRLKEPECSLELLQESCQLDFAPPQVTRGFAVSTARAHQRDGIFASTDVQRIARVYAPLLPPSVFRRAIVMASSNSITDVESAGTLIFGALVAAMTPESNIFDSEATLDSFVSQRGNLHASSFWGNTGSPSRFCRKFSRKNDRTSNGENRIAVCYVGLPRTMMRPDVQVAFRERFLAGLGIDHVKTFALLVDDGDLTQRGLDNITLALEKYNTVMGKIFTEDSTGQGCGQSTCRDGSEVRQLKQWDTCLQMIIHHEQQHRSIFDAVVKIRPDDLWYGPMVPNCILNITHRGYIGHQPGRRWSDQWFMLPRQLAEFVFQSVRYDLRPHCQQPNHGSGEQPTLVLWSKGLPPFEEQIFDSMKKHARRLEIKIVSSYWPRILSRRNPEASESPHLQHRAQLDLTTKCNRFLWWRPEVECKSIMIGTDAAIVNSSRVALGSAHAQESVEKSKAAAFVDSPYHYQQGTPDAASGDDFVGGLLLEK